MTISRRSSKPKPLRFNREACENSRYAYVAKQPGKRGVGLTAPRTCVYQKPL